MAEEVVEVVLQVAAVGGCVGGHGVYAHVAVEVIDCVGRPVDVTDPGGGRGAEVGGCGGSWSRGLILSE